MIRCALPQNHPWQDKIQIHTTLPSTNTHAKALAQAGAPEGTVVIADSQTAGRGRLGRSFHSPAGSGLYLSVVLRPQCAPAALMHLTCAAAVAVCDAVEETLGFRPRIKWINDLVAGKKKLAGILTELSLTPQGLVDFAVVGIGINCTQRAGEFPPELEKIACSAAMVTGQMIDRNALASAIVIHLETMNRQLISCRQEILRRYRQDCITLGAEVRLLGQDRQILGTALDLDDTGGLLVQLRDGSTLTVNSGEVSVRGLWDYV